MIVLYLLAAWYAASIATATGYAILRALYRRSHQ